MKYEIAVTVGVGFMVGIVVSTSPAAAQRGGDRCDFASELSVEVSASDAQRLTISAGSGSLVVEGRSGASAVTATATACASEEWMLDEMEIALDRRGSTVDLETLYPEDAWRRDGYARIDLRVEVPLGMAAEVEDGSGSATLSGLGELRVNDGSGDLYIEDIRGTLDIEDGSGGLEITGVQGDVFVEDGSGSMEIVGVTGSVTVEDGSGSMDIRDVGEHVMAYEIGSGILRVSGVEGDLTVEDGRNERIRYSGVEGTVDIPAPRRRRGGRR
jgi:hypothetical protein